MNIQNYGQNPYGQYNAPQSQYNVPPSNNNSFTNGIPWVQGEAGAKSWVMAPGSTVLLMDSECDRFYVKSADTMGKPVMETYVYHKAEDEELHEKDDVPTRDEFDELWDKLDAIERKLKKKKKGEEDE